MGPSSASFLSLPKPAEQHMAAVPRRRGQRQLGGWAGRSPYYSPTYCQGASRETQTSQDGKGAAWKEGVRCSGQGDKMAASAAGGKRASRPLAACHLPSRAGAGVRATRAPCSRHRPRPWGSEDGYQKKKPSPKIQSPGAFTYLSRGARPRGAQHRQLQLQSATSASGPELRVQNLGFTFFCESSDLWDFIRVPRHYCSLWGSGFIPTYTRFPR